MEKNNKETNDFVVAALIVGKIADTEEQPKPDTEKDDITWFKDNVL